MQVENSDYKLLITSNESDTEIEISGELTISNSKNIYSQLIEVSNSEHNIRIIIKEPVTLDLSFVQILVSFLKTRKNNGRITHITNDLSDLTKSLLAKTGAMETILELENKA